MTEPKRLGAWGVLWRSIYSKIARRNINICFLKCDERGCPHIEFWDVIDEGMIDKPCPRCSSNLMTKEEFYAGPQFAAKTES